MLLLSLLVETGQLPGTGLTQADKTCTYTIKLLFGDSQGRAHGFQGRAHGFQGGAKAPLPPINATLGRC